MSSPLVPRSPSLWLIERLLRHFYAPLSAFASIAIIANEVAIFGVAPSNWDWLFISAAGASLAGIYLSLSLPDKLTEALTRLTNRGVLSSSDGNLADLLALLHRKARLSALVGAVAFIAVISVSWILMFVSLGYDLGYQFANFWLYVILEVIFAASMGLFVGRALSYSQLYTHLSEAGFSLTPDPEHLDGAAGLRPIGNFYFYQSGLLGIPGGFLFIWIIWLSLSDSNYLLAWKSSYGAMFLFVIFCQLLGFVVPMLPFHRLMVNYKNDHLRETDKLSRRYVRERFDAASRELWAKRYEAIESMATWPTDIRLRRKFELRNILLLIPVVVQAQNIPGLADSIRKIFSG